MDFTYASYQFWINNGAPQFFTMQSGRPISETALNSIADILVGEFTEPGTTVSEILKAEATSVTIT